MKYYLTIALIWMILFEVSAQKRIEKKANNHYNNLNYIEAIETYKSLEEKKPSLQNKIRIAESYRRAKYYIDAEFWYAKVVDSELAEPIYNFYFAEVLRNNGRYELAAEYYKKYFTVNEKTIKYVNAAENPSQFVTDEEGIYKVTNLDKFNTKEGEFPCFLYPDNDRIIITSSRSYKNTSSVYGWNNERYYNLYEINLSKKSVEAIKGKVNTHMHEGTATINPQTQELVFTRNNMLYNKKQLDIDNTLHLSIFFGKKGSKKKVKDIRPFEHNSKSYSVGHPTFDEKGNIMLFVSDMPGGFGGTDIYMCIKENKGWSIPVNLGPAINSDRDEMFPFLASDGTLYFSSEGHPGLGGLDIFKSESIGERQWGEPSNIGSPINSSKDDFAFIVNKKGNIGFFGSNREGGVGSDDMYKVTIKVSPDQLIKEKPCVDNLSGIVTDEENDMPLEGVRIIAIDDKTKEKTFAFSDAKGKYEIQLKCNNVYKITFEKDQYFSKSIPLITTQDEKEHNETLSKIVVDKAMPISNIYYDLDKYNIRPDAALELDKILRMLKDNNKLIIELSSHTDSRGSKTYNQTLSENRAKSAVAYLVSKGMDNRRLYPKGYGESILINECADGVKCSEEKHADNRRTEFKVIGFSWVSEDKTLAKSDEFEMVLLSKDYQSISKGPEYYIQIGVFKNPDLTVIEKYTDLGVIKYEPVDAEMKRILLGVYPKHSIAVSYLEKVKQRGTKDAFIVAFIDGKKVTIEEAQQKEK